MSDYDEFIKVLRKDHEYAMEEYLKKPNPKLDEFIRGLTDEELFLLFMIVLFNAKDQIESKSKEEN